MPELPEVETTLLGITPHIIHQKVTQVTIRHHGLRWPIPKNIPNLLKNQKILSVTRRAKYLLLHFKNGTIILHLGMSGSLRILKEPAPARKHDHVDIAFSNHKILRFTDPRRFGALLWTENDPNEHALLRHLGPEPFSAAFSGEYLWKKAQGKSVAVKTFLMDNKVVVGVGNIYVAESLFAAGIDPRKSAKDVSLEKYKVLAKEVKKILKNAIKQGGTTLKDFVDSEGKPGYFRIQLKVYGREGLPCPRCSCPLSSRRIGQRSTIYCENCQK